MCIPAGSQSNGEKMYGLQHSCGSWAETLNQETVSGQTTLKLPGVCWLATHSPGRGSAKSAASADQEDPDRLSTGRFSQVGVGGPRSEFEDNVKRMAQRLHCADYTKHRKEAKTGEAGKKEESRGFDQVGLAEAARCWASCRVELLRFRNAKAKPSPEITISKTKTSKKVAAVEEEVMPQEVRELDASSESPLCSPRMMTGWGWEEVMRQVLSLH